MGDYSGLIGQHYNLYERISSPTLQIVMANTVAKYLEEKNIPRPLIVDLGCGNGRSMEHILRTCQGDVIGVDCEPVMLTQARKRLEEYCGRVLLVESDVLGLPMQIIKRIRPDVIASAEMIHNLPPEQRLLVYERVFYALDGGFFVNADKFALDNGEEHRKNFLSAISTFEALNEMGMPELRDAWLRHMERDETQGYKQYVGETADLLNRIGFKNVEVVWREGLFAIIRGIKP